MKIYQFIVILCYFILSPGQLKMSTTTSPPDVLQVVLYHWNKNWLKQTFSKSLNYILISLLTAQKEIYCKWYMNFLSIKIYILIHDLKAPTVCAYAKTLIYIHPKALKARGIRLLCFFIINFLCNEWALLKNISPQRKLTFTQIVSVKLNFTCEFAVV